ncbi:MAG: hypothetical protein ACOCXA_06920 [Planctomycetota bacterium]
MSVPNAPIIGYRNLLRLVPLAATGDDDPARSVDWRLDRAWRPGSTSATITTSAGAGPADYCAIAGHNLGGGEIRISAWRVGRFQQVAVIYPEAAECRLVSFPPRLASRWQIAFSSLNPLAVSVLALGSSLRLDSGMRPGFTPPPFTQQAEVLTTTSQDGIPLGRTIRRRPGQLTINPTDVDDEWMRLHWLPFRGHALVHPFFLAWNPQQWPEEACICWSEDAPTANSYTRPGFMDASMQCRVLSAVPA